MKLQNLTHVINVYAGRYHKCALTSNGKVFCWGDNSRRQIGNNAISFFNPTSTEVSGPAGVSGSSVNGWHACATTNDETVPCWGDNSKAQLGSVSESTGTPLSVAGVTDVADLATEVSDSCARKRDGSVVCWGRDDNGELGDAMNQPSRGPVGMKALSDVIALGGGEFQMCAIKTGGVVVCWGNNTNGALVTERQ